MKRILNLGCGKGILKDTPGKQYVNVDMLNSTAPNFIRHNITKVPYPFESQSFDEIYFFHCIEHIREEEQTPILWELRRLLKEDGKLAISYPEFIECAKNYIEDKNGQRDFWKATIYGRGLTKWDQHRALMNTPDFIQTCHRLGLKVFKAGPEKSQPHNSVVVLELANGIVTYEQLMSKEFQPGTNTRSEC